MARSRSANYCVVLTTYAREPVGKAIIDALLTARLAACIQVLPIRSFYSWKGKVVRDAEKLMLIKARAPQFRRIRDTILRLHDYEVPEVIRIPIDAGSSAYLDWIKQATR